MDLQISIIIPIYNKEEFLAETFDSVLCQTHQNWECILVDDGSTDESLQICNTYVKKDKRFKLYQRSENYGPGGNGARNMGIDKADGAWLMFLDADDLLIEQCLSHRLDALYAHKCELDLLIFHTGQFHKKIYESEKLWNLAITKSSPYENLLRFLNQDLPWCTNSILWRKDFIVSIGKWDECLLAWQDWELNIRSLLQEPKIYIDNMYPDNYYRRGFQNAIGSSYLSAQYRDKVVSAIVKVEKNCQPDNNLIRMIKPIILRELLHRPIKSKLFFYPLKLIFSGTKFHSISIISIAYYYILFLLFRYLQVRRAYGFVFGKSIFEKLNKPGAHLQVDIKDTNLIPFENYEKVKQKI